jgi:predicted DNA-binding ribbon-helix-helix protein
MVTKEPADTIVVERVQTGVRMEKRMLKVLKALADYHDMSLGDLLEGIVLHAFEGKPPFGEENRARIAEFKRIFGLELNASHAHRLIESRPTRKGKSRHAG